MELQDVDVTPLPPERFREVLSSEGLAAFQRTIEHGRELLHERTLWTVNSTARGGGVAEMLQSLVGYVRGAGIDARWIVIEGDPEFFRITKRLHNRLHGAHDGAPLGAAEREAYERCCDGNAELLAGRLGPRDVVLLHDPQTAGMIPRLTAAGVRVIWRAHIGLDLPNDAAREGWDRLIVQKSLAEGFGLTVSEAMWKGRAVVASRVGGIQDQIEEDVTGFLVEPDDLVSFGERVGRLLDDPHAAERIGHAAGARVRDHFLGPRHLGQYVQLLERVL